MKNIALLFISLIILAGISVPAKAQVLSDPPKDVINFDNELLDVKPVPLPAIRQADMMWSKRIWREIDMRQKINQPFYYPIEPHDNWRNFISVIMDALKEGTITAYDISNTDEFTIPLNYQEIISRQIDTMHKTFQRPYPPYEEYDTVIYSEFNPSKVTRIRIKEDWYFDKKHSQMLVRILGICPVMTKERNNEEYNEALFWIYFPEARPVLAHAQVFNRFNDASRRTYDEIFIKRLFNSYIYKEQNVYDRRIQEYAQGLDALLEAERIKMELLNFEQSLWEY
ncbi:MAG TPA: gliding motility protein GldN [Bacteroidales bacterium]|jgi:gliding motility associated protien GldN|nr:gliding motility protein GldN [Bacteroidales bacterium]HNQ82593.1 gliding motility protein GldN [Bacteroidales bacterium]HOX78300.1 gliding motility protein GldN [Bacteroidales bacterium]HPI85808.1 gliding motility protein GldN [Bacteroidales bacterium]HPM92278.1 gliding motility protein GldN [Bacteroidales bacterium]